MMRMEKGKKKGKQRKPVVLLCQMQQLTKNVRPFLFFGERKRGEEEEEEERLEFPHRIRERVRSKNAVMGQSV